MPRYKNRNGVRIQFTAEEEVARDAVEAQNAIDNQAIEDAKTAREARLASAKAKLEALGLTSDEVKDTFGL